MDVHMEFYRQKAHEATLKRLSNLTIWLDGLPVAECVSGVWRSLNGQELMVTGKTNITGD